MTWNMEYEKTVQELSSRMNVFFDYEENQAVKVTNKFMNWARKMPKMTSLFCRTVSCCLRPERKEDLSFESDRNLAIPG